MLVHGWATDSSVWEGRNAITRGEVLNIDLPGHGGKAVWDEPTLAPAIKEIFNAVSGFPDGSVTAIGWSLGAEALIAASLEDPRKFHSLVLVAATPCFVEKEDFPWGQPKALVKRMLMDMKKEPGATLERFYPLSFTEEEMKGKGAREFIERFRYPGPIRCDADTPGCFPAFRYGEITKALEALYNTDLRDGLNKIAVPTLIVHGGLDNVCPVGAGRYLAARIKGARLVIFEDAGHAPFITEPERFDDTIREFYRGT